MVDASAVMKPASSDAADLAAWAERRDELAFTHIVDRHFGLVRAACHRQLGRGDIAEEAVQAVFILLARRAADIARPEQLGSWLYGAAIRVCHNARRAAIRRQHHELRAATQATSMTIDKPACPWAELRPLLDQAIDALNHNQRDAVIGHFLEGRSQAEIAADLGISENAVQKRISKSLDKLRTWFGRCGHVVSTSVLCAMLADEASAAESGLAPAVAQAALHPTSGGMAVALAGGTTMAAGLPLAGIAVIASALLVVAGVAAWVAHDRPEPAAAPVVIVPVPAASDRPPDRGVSIRDLGTGVNFVRLTDNRTEPAASAGVPLGHGDPWGQPFSPDGRYVLVMCGSDWSWHLYDPGARAYVRALPDLGDAQPQWEQGHPARLLFLPEGSMALESLDPDNGTRHVLIDFRGRLPWPGVARLSGTSAWSGADDGSLWAFAALDAGGACLGVFTWNRGDDRIVGTRETGGACPHGLWVSKSGRHVMMTDGRDMPVEAFNPALQRRVRVREHDAYGCTGIDRDGHDVYVALEGSHIVMTDLDSGLSTPLVDLGRGAGAYCTASSSRRPGWALVSAYSVTDASENGLVGTIFALELAPQPRVVPLVQHRSAPIESHAGHLVYWCLPQVAADRDFTRMVFNSNWGQPCQDRVEAYLVSLRGLIPPDLDR